MTGGHITEYDLIGFDGRSYAAETGRAAAVEYRSPNLADARAHEAQLGLAVGDLLRTAMIHDRIDLMPFTICDELLVVAALKGHRPAGVTVIDSVGDIAHDIVTWLTSADERPAAQAFKIELLRHVRDADIDRAPVLAGTETETIYNALGQRPVEAAS